jgi:hypothetical protein
LLLIGRDQEGEPEEEEGGGGLLRGRNELLRFIKGRRGIGKSALSVLDPLFSVGFHGAPVDTLCLRWFTVCLCCVMEYEGLRTLWFDLVGVFQVLLVGFS